MPNNVDQKISESDIELGNGFFYQPYSKNLRLKNQDIPLMQQEILLLEALLHARNQIVSYETLISAISKETESTVANLRTLIKLLRNKTYKGLIQNLHSFGYKLVLKSPNELSQLSITDTCLNAIVKREVAYTKRYKTPLSLLLFDIETLTKMDDNDSDKIKKNIHSKLIEITKETLRSTDVFFNLEGNFFLILCPQANEEQMFLLAQRLQEKIETNTFEHGQVRIIGVVAQYQPTESIEKTIERSSHALQQAKENNISQIIRINGFLHP